MTSTYSFSHQRESQGCVKQAAINRRRQKSQRVWMWSSGKSWKNSRQSGADWLLASFCVLVFHFVTMQRLWVLLQMSFTRFMQMALICMKERSPSFNFAPTSRDTWHPEMQNGVAFNAASHLLAVRAGHVSLNEACGLSPGPYSVCLPFPLPACRRQTHNRSDRIRWHSQTLQACAAAALSHS